MKKTTYKKGTFDKMVQDEKFYYVNSDLNEKKFPIISNNDGTVGELKWKVIKMERSFTSQEALDRIKMEGCRPANALELLLWKHDHGGEMKKGTYIIALGQLWKASGGRHRVPCVSANTGGDFYFLLGDFEDDCSADFCLLCVCDKKYSESLSLKNDLEPLILSEQEMIDKLKEKGFKITRFEEKEY